MLREDRRKEIEEKLFLSIENLLMRGTERKTTKPCVPDRPTSERLPSEEELAYDEFRILFKVPYIILGESATHSLYDVLWAVGQSQNLVAIKADKSEGVGCYRRMPELRPRQE